MKIYKKLPIDPTTTPLTLTRTTVTCPRVGGLHCGWDVRGGMGVVSGVCHGVRGTLGGGWGYMRNWSKKSFFGTFLKITAH